MVIDFVKPEQSCELCIEVEVEFLPFRKKVEFLENY
jgi:hypothetical protein